MRRIILLLVLGVFLAAPLASSALTLTTLSYPRDTLITDRSDFHTVSVRLDGANPTLYTYTIYGSIGVDILPATYRFKMLAPPRSIIGQYFQRDVTGNGTYSFIVDEKNFPYDRLWYTAQFAVRSYWRTNQTYTGTTILSPERNITFNGIAGPHRDNPLLEEPLMNYGIVYISLRDHTPSVNQIDAASRAITDGLSLNVTALKWWNDASRAGAHEDLLEHWDEEAGDNSSDTDDELYTTHWLSQAFTIGVTGPNYGSVVMEGVSVKLWREGTGALTLYAYLRSNLSGVDLASGSISGANITTKTAGDWYFINTSAYTLPTTGTFYLVLRSTGSSANKVHWRIDTGTWGGNDPHYQPNGYIYKSATSGTPYGSWSTGTYHALWDVFGLFSTHGTGMFKIHPTSSSVGRAMGAAQAEPLIVDVFVIDGTVTARNGSSVNSPDYQHRIIQHYSKTIQFTTASYAQNPYGEEEYFNVTESVVKVDAANFEFNHSYLIYYGIRSSEDDAAYEYGRSHYDWLATTDSTIELKTFSVDGFDNESIVIDDLSLEYGFIGGAVYYNMSYATIRGYNSIFTPGTVGIWLRSFGNTIGIPFFHLLIAFMIIGIAAAIPFSFAIRFDFDMPNFVYALTISIGIILDWGLFLLDLWMVAMYFVLLAFIIVTRFRESIFAEAKPISVPRQIIGEEGVRKVAKRFARLIKRPSTVPDTGVRPRSRSDMTEEDWLKTYNGVPRKESNGHPDLVKWQQREMQKAQLKQEVAEKKAAGYQPKPWRPMTYEEKEHFAKIQKELKDKDIERLIEKRRKK